MFIRITSIIVLLCVLSCAQASQVPPHHVLLEQVTPGPTEWQTMHRANPSYVELNHAIL
jgi:hypothetical protein